MSDAFDTPSVAELHAYRAAIIRARARGEKRVSYIANGVERTVELRTDSELRVALADIERRLDAAQGRSAVNVVNLRSVKGFA